MNNDLETIVHPSSEKIVAMYQAVLDLLEEGRDASSLKVIDITNKAGIGKGTAYDYFRSKEEIIVDSILYSMHHAIEEGTKQLEQSKTFQEKILTIFSFLENRGKICDNIKRFMPYWSGANKELLDSIKEKYAYFGEYGKIIQQLLLDIYQTGVTERILGKDKEIFIINCAFISQIMTFFKYLEKPEAFSYSSEEFKIYLYENLVYMLR